MRIDGSRVDQIDDSRKDAQSRMVARQEASNDAVVVSARAKKLSTHATETAAARDKRMTEIGSALEAGTYKVDHQKLAERLVDEEVADSMAAVAELEEILLRERGAIALLDVVGIAALAGEKQTAAARLGILLHPDTIRARFAPGDQSPARRRLREALTRLRADAEANRALLDDVIAIVAEARGLARDSGTYDARARRRMSVTARQAKGV
jgi:anti-sigma28 factor (negative regulator of flagellin synthesis)